MPSKLAKAREALLLRANPFSAISPDTVDKIKLVCLASERAEELAHLVLRVDSRGIQEQKLAHEILGESNE